MRRDTFRIVLLPVTVIALIAFDARVLRAQSNDDLFDPQTLQEIRLSINSMDFQRLQHDYLENTYYTADLQWRTLRVRNIGVRSRGSASRSGSKPGIHIEFDRYVGGQEFLGLRALVLDNLWQDPAMIRERIAMAFFARMGEPAPRESFCRLYINNVYYGVYAVVEAVTKEFLKRTRGDENGYLFEYKNQSPYYFEYLGDDLSAYKPFFEPRSHHLEADVMLYAPIRDLVREINEPEDELWRDRVEAHLDLSQFVTHVAIETFLAEWDGVIGAVGMANFYLARDSASGPHRLIPWDKDLTFSDAGFPIFFRAEENVLFRRALNLPDMRTKYLDVLEACARSARGWLFFEIVRTANVIAAVANEDTRKPYSNDEVKDAVDVLKRFARQRSGYVLAEVAKARRGRL
jgi:spore coat protein CotH